MKHILMAATAAFALGACTPRPVPLNESRYEACVVIINETQTAHRIDDVHYWVINSDERWVLLYAGSRTALARIPQYDAQRDIVVCQIRGEDGGTFE